MIRTTTRLKISFAAIATLGIFLAACEKGPAETAGQKVDKAVQKTGEAVKETGEKIKDAGK